MAKRYLGGGVFVVTGLLAGALGPGTPAGAQELGEQALRQIRAIYADKAAWTPAQRKLATSLLYASREGRGQPMLQGLPAFRRVADRARVDRDGMVLVDIRADVTDDLLQAIAGRGGQVVLALADFGAVRARVPIQEVEAIAALPEVRYISPRQGFLVNTGSQTSQGDVAHAAASARNAYGVSGAGVKIGVLSDGVDTLAARQGTADLPPTCPQTGACVQVVPGQAGSGDEGTAMLEIVHDLAPGAKLYFATGIDTDAAFAANILALRNTYGCDIIVDDLTYFNEGAFQDGVIAQAVNTVTAAGALYFSSAGNSGRKDAGTSGTWEGDYLNSGRTIAWFTGSDWEGKEIHSWNALTGASAVHANALTAVAPYAISLKWGDPLGAATTDYDLFIFDADLANVWDYSVDDQATTLQPYEIMGFGNSGEKIVVVRWSGATKALRLDTNRGQLTWAGARAIVGHNGAEHAISVAATNVATAAGGVFTGGTANPIEVYSSDGPRRMFYNPDGSPKTPGNVLFGTGGGQELQKPDITAGDCVTVTTPGFSPFCGTSAAAPAAAAIAALLKSVPSVPTGAQVLSTMLATTLDVSPSGRDRNAGAGIAMAYSAVSTFFPLEFYTLSPCRVFDTRSGAPLTCGTDRTFTVAGPGCGVPVGAKSVSFNVTVTGPTAAGTLRLFAAGDPVPLVSSVNYAAGQTRGNNGVAPLNAAGQMAARCSPSGTAHVILDVNGYFR